MSTYPLRLQLVNIARRDKDKTEVTKNQAPWIKKLWTGTNYPDGMENREPYCAAGVCYCVMRWLENPEVLKALKLTPAQAEKWRPKSASVYKAGKNSLLGWAKAAPGVQVLGKNVILKMGDILIYGKSHTEFCTDDDNTTTGPLVAIGYNTDASGARDGEGCFEKPRSRKDLINVIRILSDS